MVKHYNMSLLNSKINTKSKSNYMYSVIISKIQVSNCFKKKNNSQIDLKFKQNILEEGLNNVA